MGESSEIFVHSVAGTGRLIPSSSRWNSVEVNYKLLPTSLHSYDFTPAKFSKSFEFNLKLTDKTRLKRFVYVSVSLLLLIILVALLATFLHRKHSDHVPSSNLSVALGHAISFFDAQKSGRLRNKNSIKFRGDSGLRDGHWGRTNASLVGGFYDSGNNIKFSFPTAYTVSLLSWSVIEYHDKYAEVDQLEHIRDIIRWGSDYLLNLYVPSTSTSQPALLYSQVGSGNRNAKVDNDITCWQRPEDMTYARPVLVCESSAADLAGEIAAALAASSIVFNQDRNYSKELIKTSESLFQLATKKNQHHETYTTNTNCGGEARNFYNSSSYADELVWGGIWLFFATGNSSYLKYATENFELAAREELASDSGILYWNNKMAANAVLLTRLRYLHDPGYPYEYTLKLCSDMSSKIMCSYLCSPQKFNVTSGGLMLLKPNSTAPLQFAATAAFLSKLYSDYLNTIQIPSLTCSPESFTTKHLESLARSQVQYILGDNPLKLSYLVGFGDRYPKEVHHRGASIPGDGKYYSCTDGKKWRDSKDPNPNDLVGAMVGGPDNEDRFLDDRGWPEHTEPTIFGNAGLVAALIALLDDIVTSRVDADGIFANIPTPFN